MRGGGSVDRVGELAVVAGVGAAVFLGWGCAAASADDSVESSSASDSSESAQRTDEDPSPRDKKPDEEPGKDEAAESLPDNDDRDRDIDTSTAEDDSPTVHADLNPPEDADPPPPAPAATAQWTMMGAARREVETEDVAPSLDKPAELPAARANSVVYTADPTFFDQVTVAGHRLVDGFSQLIGVDLHGLIANALERDHPPSFLTHGLDARKTAYQVSDGNTWQVWELRPPNPTGKTVVAVHDGSPLLTHWIDYTNSARDTGATVIVPMYPPETTDAAMAQFISRQIDLHGAEDVSVYADSAGTVLAMSALRHLVVHGRPVPAGMVLLSPAPDASPSNPDIHDVFAALPPTTIYVGSLEIGLPDTLLLQQKWAAAGGAVSVVVGRGQIHDWALGGSLNSQSPQVRPDIYRQLGLNGAGTGPTTITTGPPSFGDQFVVWGLRTLRWFSEVTGIKLFSGVVGAVVSKSPPPSTTTGLIVTERDFNGWTVWELASDQPSGEFVVALHGGGFESEANIIHWSDYTSMVRDTGATVLVPIYPLAPPQGTGTATTLVPPMADYLSMLIDEHGVDNVSLYGDSAGGSLSLLAVQEMLRRCRSDVQCVPDEELPSRMVLVSPALHLTLGGPEVDAIDDPILPKRAPGEGPRFNGELDMDDPRVNPISSADLTGLPPTTVYIGTLEKLYPGALAFRDKLLAQDPDADFTVIIGDGQIHGWALAGIILNSQTPLWRPTVYRQLGLLPEDSARYVTLSVA